LNEHSEGARCEAGAAGGGSGALSTVARARGRRISAGGLQSSLWAKAGVSTALPPPPAAIIAATDLVGVAASARKHSLSIGAAGASATELVPPEKFEEFGGAPAWREKHDVCTPRGVKNMMSS
jgi:hypothetical protein